MICEMLEDRFGRRAGRWARTAWGSALAMLGLWAALGAYRRVTARAPGTGPTESDVAAYRPDTGRPDVTAQLRSLLACFLNPPVAAADASYGPWSPAARPELRLIVSYLDLPATRKAMDDLARLPRGSLTIPPIPAHGAAAAAGGPQADPTS